MSFIQSSDLAHGDDLSERPLNHEKAIDESLFSGVIETLESMVATSTEIPIPVRSVSGLD